MGEVKDTGKRAVNRLVVGLLFLLIFGLVAGLSAILLGVPLNADLQDLGAGIDNLNSLAGLGQIFFWILSTLIVAGIALFLVAKMTFFVPFKGVEKKPDIPKRTFVITFVILGAIIAFLFFLTNSVLKIFGQDLSVTDIETIVTAFVEGDFMTLFIGLLFAIVIGTIVVAVASRTGSIQKAGSDVGLPKV